MTIWDYYDRLEHLRTLLIDRGLLSWSQELLDAERGATTAGEALSNTGVVLERLIADEGLADGIVKDAVQAAIEDNNRIETSRPFGSNNG